MRHTLCLLLALAFLIPASLKADEAALRLSLSFSTGKAGIAPLLSIENISKSELSIMSPDSVNAIAFAVIDARTGNFVMPELLAKVEAVSHEPIALKPGDTLKCSSRDFTAISSSEGMLFPFHTGTALMAYRLEKGVNYRITAIYRPSGFEKNGVASEETSFSY